MKLNNAAEFLQAELEPGLTVIDNEGEEWLVLDKVSYTKKGQGLARTSDGLYYHALHVPTYPLYDCHLNKSLDDLKLYDPLIKALEFIKSKWRAAFK